MTPDEITPAWLSATLGVEVTSVRSERVGTGQMGSCYRLRLDDDRSVLAKLPPDDRSALSIMRGAYECEIRFYTQLASTVAVRVPACHHAEMDPDTGDFVVLLEDLAPRRQGDQIAGCTPRQARPAAVNLAGLHGPRWKDASLLEVEGLEPTDAEQADLLANILGQATEVFLDGLGDLVSAADATLLREFVGLCAPWILARSDRFGLVHGDYRLDNLMFGADDDVVAVDWQTLALGLPARDLAYFVETSLAPEERRAHERDLVAAYHAALVGHGVEGYSLEQCWDDYVFALPQGILVSVLGCAYGARTDRGDRMFAVMVERSCTAIRDHDAFSLVRSTRDLSG